MQFGDPLASGIYLVREALRSPNYVPGVSGWTINADGSAEFFDVDIRGRLATGEAPNAYVELFDTQTGYAQVILSTNDPAQTNPGFVFATQLVGAGNALYLDSPQVGFGRARIKLLGQQDAVSRPQIEFSESGALDLLAKVFGDIEVTGTYQPGGIAQFDSLHSTGDIISDLSVYGNFVEGDTAVQAGLSSGLHTYLNVNQLQAFNAGAGSPLYLNWSNGAAVNIGAGGLLVNGVLTPGSIAATTVGGVSLSGGVVSTGGSAVGTSFIIGGGQLNAAVSPPTTGTAANATWILTGGTNYRLNRFTSSRKYKENIRDLELDCARVLELRPRVFQRNDNRDYKAWRFQSEPEPIVPVTEKTPWEVGFIAEEADELGLSQWVEKQDGEIESFSYQLFVVAQHAVLRSQQKTIETLESRIAKLEAIVNALPDGLKR